MKSRAIKYKILNIKKVKIVLEKMFIGREEELNELKNWLESGKPCIAVTGMGGIGKTTLVKGFTSTKDFKRMGEGIYISLKGETEVVQPIKIVLEGIGKGLGGKVAEGWRKIKEVDIHGKVKLPGDFGAGLGIGVKKEVKEEAEKSLKQILHDLDSRLKKGAIIIVDDLQLADDKSLRLICELANVNWKNLKWTLIHREKGEIKEELKDLSGWTPLVIEGLNKDDISTLFIEYAKGRIKVKGIDKDAFFEVTKGYPNFIDTIVSALKEKYDKIEVTEDFINENYDAFTRPMEFVMENYVDEDEKLNLLSVAILKEGARVGSIVNSFRIPIYILNDFLTLLGADLKYKNLNEFGFIKIRNEEINMHDAKLDRIIEVMNEENKEQVKRVRKAAIEFYLGIASIANKELDHITTSKAFLHAYHHASYIDNRIMLKCLVDASVNFSNYGDNCFAYICSNYVLELISEQMRQDEHLAHLKLVALAVKCKVLFSKGLYSYFEFNLAEIVEEVTKAFFSLEKSKQEKIRKRGLEDYIKVISNIMSYFTNEGKADEILGLLKNSPLKKEQKATLKIHASEGLTYLWDERAKELLEEVNYVEDIEDKYRILYIKGLWNMDDFEKASELFEDSAKGVEFDPLLKGLAVKGYSLAAVLTSDKLRALKILMNAEENLVGDVEPTLGYKFANAIVSENREKRVNEFFTELSSMQLGDEQKRRYGVHYSQAFILLDYLEGLSLDEEAISVIEDATLYEIISLLNDSREALRRLGDVEMLPMYKNILKCIISEGNAIEAKMAKFIGFYFLTTG